MDHILHFWNDWYLLVWNYQRAPEKLMMISGPPTPVIYTNPMMTSLDVSQVLPEEMKGPS